MARFVMRVWLTDRPGALGSLASALGGVGADVIGIDILERDAGRVVDEVTVEVPGARTIEELASAVSEVPGAQVEDVRPVVARLAYPGSDPLDLAVGLGAQRTSAGLAHALVHGVAAVFASEWAAVLDDASKDPGAYASPATLAVAGNPPPSSWLGAFVSGASSQAAATRELHGPRDIAWARLEHAGASVVVGRGGPPFRSKERHQLVQLCRIADGRWRELAIRAGMIAHPSTGYSERTHPAAAS